jgi:hypothetical protein
MDRKNLMTLGIGFVVIVVIPIGWWLLSPLWTTVEVNESFPTVPAPVSTEASAPVAVEPTLLTEIQAEPTEEVASSDSDMSMLIQGSFYNVAHAGSGQAGLYQLADGSRILRLENFQVENGPDLYVYLVPLDSVPNTIGSEIAGSVSLGKLKGNVGDQNYDIPADLDLSQFKSVVIWCQAFAVPFSAAPLN